MRNLIIVFIACLVVLLSGCTPDDPISTDPFLGGSDGISMEFVDGSPPPEIYDNGQFPFDVTLRLENKGEADVASGSYKIELSGISSRDFGGPSYTKVPTETLIAAYKDQQGNRIDGAVRYVTFDTPAFSYKDAVVGDTDFTLWADICYKYKTTATTQLCVKEDVLGVSEDNVCEIKGPKRVFNSGSPVQVSSFNQNPGGKDKLAFTFEVAHAGSGAIHGGTLCDMSLTNKNKVTVKVSSSAGQIKCAGLNGGSSGEVTLYEGRRAISCTQTLSQGRDSYETPLTIDLSFNYKENENIPIRVKHAVS
ncbi:MAG: hypothetical protein GY861_00635 [bacterium]|nr:hypothetical protein [bacterium]